MTGVLIYGRSVRTQIATISPQWADRELLATPLSAPIIARCGRGAPYRPGGPVMGREGGGGGGGVSSLIESLW